MTTQNILDPSIYGTREAPRQVLPKALPVSILSKEAQKVFAIWPEYIKALGKRPSACYITSKQAATINKSVRRKFGEKVSVTDFTYDGLAIVVHDS